AKTDGDRSWPCFGSTITAGFPRRPNWLAIHCISTDLPDPDWPATSVSGALSPSIAALWLNHAGWRSRSVKPSSADPSGSSPTVDRDTRPEYPTADDGRSSRCGLARRWEHSHISASAFDCRNVIELSW